MSWLVVQTPSGWHTVLSATSYLAEMERGCAGDLAVIRGGPGDPIARRAAAERLAERLDRFQRRESSSFARLT